MRKYYYLTRLEDSPYKLSTDEALHLGATNRLSIYFYLTARHPGKVTVMVPEFKYRDFEHVDADLVSGEDTREKVPIGTEYHYTLVDQFIRANDSTIRRLEKDKSSIQLVVNACVDNRTLPIMNGLTPTREYYLRWAQFKATSQPNVQLTDLICFSDDLDDLAQQGFIERREDKTGKLPENFRALYDAMATREIWEFEALIIAWGQFWKNADRTDKSTWPKKVDVKGWLIDQGLSAKMADSGATIIKPQWAKDQGR